MVYKLCFAALFVMMAMLMIPKPRAYARTDEHKVTYYPGNCPNGQSWYLIDSDSDSITVGCNDPDYNAPDPDEFHASN